MNGEADEIMLRRELFENSYFYFIKSLCTLAHDAEIQCDVMGNYNVAYELKMDVLAINEFIDSPDANFSQTQKDCICDLLQALNKIPASVLANPNTTKGNLDAMRHPCWTDIRKKAKVLIRLLEPITNKNREYFGIQTRSR